MTAPIDVNAGISIPDAFRTSAEKHRNQTALRDGEQSYTYDEIDRASDVLARQLQERGVEPKSFVALVGGRSSSLVVAILGVLKSGAAYAVLDPSWPEARISKMLDVLQPSAIGVDRDAPTRDGDVWLLDTVEDLLSKAGEPPNRVEISPSSPACVFFTSGTTGTPKAVVSPHAGSTRMICSDQPLITPAPVVPLAAPAPWDAFALELWSALLTGGTSMVLRDNFLTPASLRGFQAQGANALWMGAALFNVVVDEDVDSFTGYEHVLIGGERLSPSHVRTFLERHPEVRLTNGYGPVESTIFATTHDIALDDAVQGDIPIGSPVADTNVYVCRDGQPCPDGEVGELFIESSGLALEYLRAAESTERSFVSMSIEGTERRLYATGDLAMWEGDRLRYRGRADRQIKLRGYRIQLEELEVAVSKLSGVLNSAVVADVDDEGHCRSVTAYVCAESEQTERTLEAGLANVLPQYMLPEVRIVDELPLLDNGKVDRVALQRRMGAQASARFAPDEQVEADELTVGEIVAPMARTEVFSSETDLFAAGLSSLDAGRICARIEKELGVVVSLAEVLGEFSVAGIAGAIRRSRASTNSDSEALATQQASVPLRDMQIEFLLANQITSDVAANCAFGWWITGQLDEVALRGALQDVHEAFQALHGRYQLTDPPTISFDQTVSEVRFHDLGTFTDDDAAMSSLYDDLMKPLPLDQGHVWHAALTRHVEQSRWLFGVVAHHIAWDGTTEVLVVKALREAYAKRVSNLGVISISSPSMAALFHDYEAQRAAANLDDQREYWRKTLSEALPLQFVGDAASDQPAGGFDVLITSDDVALCDERARNEGTTRFAALAHALISGIQKASGVDDVTLGLPMSKRTSVRQAEGISCLIDLLCLRVTEGDSDRSDGAQLTPTVTALRDALRHSSVSFSEVVRAVNPVRTERPPLFQAMFTIEPEDDLGLVLDMCELDFFRFDAPEAMTELGCALWPREDGGYRAHFIFKTTRVAEREAQAVAEHMLATIRSYGR